MGVVFLGSVRSRASSLGGSLRLALEASALANASNSFLVGSAPYQSRYATSSNVERAASSSTSMPRYSRRPSRPSMKQMSDVETTTSSRPAFPTVLMALPRGVGW
jgi:hypothetical protein